MRGWAGQRVRAHVRVLTSSGCLCASSQDIGPPQSWPGGSRTAVKGRKEAGRKGSKRQGEAATGQGKGSERQGKAGREREQTDRARGPSRCCRPGRHQNRGERQQKTVKGQ